ncbi:MAG TPA: hypothetical protein PKZ53_08625 [Acidobacteriota bacterium]|nr:hypothetical protein [Acidobacteriota bacterium]
MIELFLARRNELNSVIEGNARLCFLLPVFNTQKVMAAIEFCLEPGDGTITFSDYYFFHFSGVTSITIGTLQSQYFPPELKNVSTPSIQLMELLLRQFRDQMIFEWYCFYARDEVLVEKFTPRLHFQFDFASPDAGEMAGFLTDVYLTGWQVWINYSELTIENHLRQSLTVEQFTESARRFLESTER